MYEPNFVQQVNAQLRYYLKVNPDSMSDDEWVEAWKGLIWVRQEEAKQNA